MKKTLLLTSVLVLAWMTWATCHADPGLTIWILGCVFYALGVGAVWATPPDQAQAQTQQQK